jgi:hypothetical protein
MTIIQQEKSYPVKSLIYWLGVALVICGALSLIYIAVMVLQLIQSPEESKFVTWVGINFKDTVMLLTGHIDETQIEISGNDKLQFFLLSILGLIALSILAGVVKALLGTGIELIKFTLNDRNKSQDSNQ